MALGQAAPQRPEYNIGELDQLPDQAKAEGRTDNNQDKENGQREDCHTPSSL